MAKSKAGARLILASEDKSPMTRHFTSRIKKGLRRKRSHVERRGG